MADTDRYKTVETISAGLYKEKGSRFVAALHPVKNENEIKTILEGIRKEHHEARHHCYAWVLGAEGIRYRSNDDGEPSGTGGRPILGQIRANGLTNILIVVSRYFGGTLLGVSGLINAYKTAAASALENTRIVEQFVMESYKLIFPYKSMNDVMKIVKEENIDHSGHLFNIDCSMNIHFRSSFKQKIIGRLSRIEGLSYLYIDSL